MGKIKTVVGGERVGFSYDGNPALEEITLTVEEKDFLGVVGPNGSGKTTLLKIILGLLTPARGKVRVFGRPPERVRQRISYVPQYTNFDMSFPISVRDVVLIGRVGKAPVLGRYRRTDQREAEQAMERARISDLRNRQFGTLSGGQKQRVLLARALVSNPDLLLLDEPTASIDGRVEQDIYELLKLLNEEITIILVTHDLGFVSSYVKHVACVNRRLVCHPTREISVDMIEACYSGPVHMIKHDCKL